jgi:hypothetical protein
MSLQLAVSRRVAAVPAYSGTMPSPYAGAAERLLSDNVARLTRQPGGRLPASERNGNASPWCALVLHLSRMSPPAPRSYHRRVARALLEDGGQAHDGQVFALGNADLVLLCRATAVRPHEHPSQPRAPDSLPEVLARLLRIDLPTSADIMSLWTLPADEPHLRAYAEARLAEVTHAAANHPASGNVETRGRSLGERPPAGQLAGAVEIDVAARLVTTLDIAVPAALLRRQTAIELSPATGGSGRLGPVHRAITLPMEGLAVPSGSEATACDPVLGRHLAARFDHRLLTAVRQSYRRGGPLDPASPLRLHLPLTLGGILSDAFAELLAASPPGCYAVELPLIEAAGDHARFAEARARLIEAAIPLVLGVSHHDLLWLRPDLLAPDLLALGWTPEIATLPASATTDLAALFQAFGRSRILLVQADIEDAVRWGVAHGIRQFRGRHVEAMLAASRKLVCAPGAACTVHQCADRAADCMPVARTACRNLALLDAAAP